MSGVLLLSVQRPEDGSWQALAPMRAGDPPGTLSDNSGPARRLYLFGVGADARSAFIWLVNEPVERLASAGAIRILDTERLSLLHELRPGQWCDLEVQTDLGRRLRRVRFAFVSSAVALL